MFPKLVKFTVKFTIEERKTDWVMWIELDETGKWIIQKWPTEPSDEEVNSTMLFAKEIIHVYKGWFKKEVQNTPMMDYHEVLNPV